MEKFSILMSVYKNDRPEWLRQAFDSVIDQTRILDDVVVVLDGPVSNRIENVLDGVKNSFDSFQIVRLSENVGLGRALSKGLNYVKNSLVARIDADDISVDNRFEIQLNEFSHNQGLAITSGAISEFKHDVDEKMTIKNMPLMHDEICEYSKLRNPFNHPAVMFRKEMVQQVGSYQHFPLFEDYHLWVRMLNSGMKTSNVPEILVNMRVGAGLYNRRGGVNHLLNAIKFRKEFQAWGWISRLDALKANLAMTVITLMPSALRKMLYTQALR